MPAPDATSGDTLRAAVRPERIRVNGEAVEGGSHLRGTIAELVYLGMYTQVGVDTQVGRVFAHRLAGEVERLQNGDWVTLTWDAEHTAPLESADGEGGGAGIAPDLRG
jgi:ABC-type Fe3+/spermidine/putrescine transport system ATPase subunit